MQEQIKTAIFDKLNNIKHLPVSIHKNVLGNKECDDLKNLIYEYKKTKVKQMDFYEPYQDVLKISQGKGGTTQVIKIEDKKDGKPIENTYVPYDKVVNIKEGETKKVVRLSGEDIDPTDVLNGEYSNLKAMLLESGSMRKKFILLIATSGRYSATCSLILESISE